MAIATQTGIISDALNEPIKPPADEYKAPEVKPITSEVDAPTETVESRLNTITAKGSTYTDLAKKDAIRSANTRGLINSTMAGAAGTDAAIRAAMPIAQQDAKTFTDTRMTNQRAQNEFLKNRQSANLNMETAGYQSQLTKDEATQKSGLTNEENTLLNSLAMKRDQGMSALTQEENAQLNALEMKRDTALSGLRTEELTTENQLAINRDNNSAALNEHLATLESSLKQAEMTLDSELRTAFETTLQDARFSDEAKIQIVNNMNSIIRDTQEQITQVGLSDRSAAQQESAINLIREMRDAELAVYQDLLSSFNDWEWSTDFTPKKSEGEAGFDQDLATQVATDEQEAKMTNPDVAPDGSGTYIRFGVKYSSSGNYIYEDGRWSGA